MAVRDTSGDGKASGATILQVKTLDGKTPTSQQFLFADPVNWRAKFARSQERYKTLKHPDFENAGYFLFRIQNRTVPLKP